MDHYHLIAVILLPMLVVLVRDFLSASDDQFGDHFVTHPLVVKHEKLAGCVPVTS